MLNDPYRLSHVDFIQVLTIVSHINEGSTPKLNINGAPGGIRTHNLFRATDFKSASYANSDTGAFYKRFNKKLVDRPTLLARFTLTP